jgi:hypothetical protein
MFDHMSLDDNDSDDVEETFSDPRGGTAVAGDPVLEAITREDATRRPSSFQPALFRFFC